MRASTVSTFSVLGPGEVTDADSASSAVTRWASSGGTTLSGSLPSAVRVVPERRASRLATSAAYSGGQVGQPSR